MSPEYFYSPLDNEAVGITIVSRKFSKDRLAWFTATGCGAITFEVTDVNLAPVTSGQFSLAPNGDQSSVYLYYPSEFDPKMMERLIGIFGVSVKAKIKLDEDRGVNANGEKVWLIKVVEPGLLFSDRNQNQFVNKS